MVECIKLLCEYGDVECCTDVSLPTVENLKVVVIIKHP